MMDIATMELQRELCIRKSVINKVWNKVVGIIEILHF